MSGSNAKRIAYRTVCAMIFLLVLSSATNSEQLPIKTYTTADGLVSNRISRIVRDSRGYLWFCTEDGLSRFDGYAFVNYTTQQGLPTNWVDDFLETSGGIFLVGTNAGLCVFDPRGEPLPQDHIGDDPATRPMFTVSRPAADGPAASISDLYEDSMGNIWCGTRAGLYRVEIADRLLTYHEIDLGMRRKEIGPQRIRRIVEESSGLLWVLTNDDLFRYSVDGRTERPALKKELPNINLMDLVKDTEGKLWVSTRAGLWRITPAAFDDGSKAPLVARSYSSEEGLACVEMTVLHQDHGGGLWAGTDYGLYELLKGESRFRLRLGVKDVRDARVWSFSEDNFGNLWVGTANGAIRLARVGFTTFTEADGIGFREVYHIAETRAGEITLYTRFGPASLFVDRFNGERFISRRVVPGAFSTRSFDWYLRQIPIQDHLGEWWWPTLEGLFRYNKADRVEDVINSRAVARYTTKDGLPVNFVSTIYEDRRGDIWISIFGSVKTHVARWERATGRFQIYSTEDGLPESRIPISFCEDNSGNVWLGFSRGCIARFREGRFTPFYAAEGVPQGEIKQLLLDSQGRIWIASSNGGLGKIEDVSAERPQIANYTTSDGLASNSILHIAEDRANQFYVATNRGLNHINFDTGGIRRFTTNDGLANNQVEMTFRDSRGAFWFLTVTGVSRLLPHATPPQTAPRILINSLKIRGETRRISEVGETDLHGLVLGPGQNQIEIGFGSLSFGAGDSIRYQYWLEGADADWQSLNTHRTVNYANLAPGGYRFLVRAVNADGVMSESPASFSFTILPPVWQRWWFIALVAALLGVIAYALYNYRVRRLLEIERVRTRIATDLHDDIGSGLSQIAIMSEVVQQQVDGRNERVSHPLSVIANTSRELVDSMADIVWAINPQRDHLIDLTQRMRQFAGDVLAARNIEFTFTAPRAKLDDPIETNMRREVFLIFKEAVNNAVRHSNCSAIKIGFDVDGGRLTLEVADNGNGFDASNAIGGHGLASIKRRAKSIGGTLEILAEPGRGTSVTLEAPVRLRHLRRMKIST